MPSEAENDEGNARPRRAGHLRPSPGKRLEFGLTTYCVKFDLGAKSVPIKMALRTMRSWANWLVALS